MSRTRRRRQSKRKRRVNQHALPDRAESVQAEVAQRTSSSTRSGPEPNDFSREPEGDRSLDMIDLLKTRRTFLRAMSTVILGGAVGGALGNIVSSGWERSRQKDLSVERFFFLFDTEQYPLAFNAGLDLLSGLPRDSQEFVLWLNNLACAAVWGGRYQNARELLRYAQLHARSWEMAVIDSNLAYVRYHLGYSTRELIPRIEMAAKVFPRQELGTDRWLQLWSRQDTVRSVIPPFGVLMRLYAKEGRFGDAFASGEADVRVQGKRAQGTRGCLGFIARPAQAERLALKYMDDMEEEHNSASSWEHMKSARDLVLSNLTNKAISDSAAFRGQATSIKGEYYSWANLADLKYFLTPGVSEMLRYEYGRLIVSSYQETGHANLDAIVQMGDLLR